MDLRAVTAASSAELIACAVAAARNAQELLYDAEALDGYGSRARAYSLAVLAVEESGKARGGSPQTARLVCGYGPERPDQSAVGDHRS